MKRKSISNQKIRVYSIFETHSKINLSWKFENDFYDGGWQLSLAAVKKDVPVVCFVASCSIALAWYLVKMDVFKLKYLSSSFPSHFCRFSCCHTDSQFNSGENITTNYHTDHSSISYCVKFHTFFQTVGDKHHIHSSRPLSLHRAALNIETHSATVQ